MEDTSSPHFYSTYFIYIFQCVGFKVYPPSERTYSLPFLWTQDFLCTSQYPVDIKIVSLQRGLMHRRIQLEGETVAIEARVSVLYRWAGPLWEKDFVSRLQCVGENGTVLHTWSFRMAGNWLLFLKELFNCIANFIL